MIPYYLKKNTLPAFCSRIKTSIDIAKKGYTRFHSKGNILNTFEWNIDSMETPYHLLLKHWVFLVKKRKRKKNNNHQKSRFFIHTKGCKNNVCKMMSLLLAFKKKGKEKNCC